MTSIVLDVCPNLKPTSSLKTELLSARLGQLAQKESQKGLVDQGGLMHTSGEKVLKSERGSHPNGFIHAAITAFADHHPLSIRPQHFWLLILQGVAVHIRTNAEEVRKKWVAHEGKKELIVRRDSFVLNQKNDWQSVVEGQPDSFDVQIAANVVPGVSDDINPAFSDTSAVERTALNITVMDVCQSFFSYTCMTSCGFPRIRMEGSRNDWATLRTNAEHLLKSRCDVEFANQWCEALLPLLDKLVQEYDKGHAKAGGGASNAKGDKRFWNSMCKRGGTSGSGARTWFNGWINILFPFINEKPNRYMVPYSPDIGYAKEDPNRTTYPGFGSRIPDGVQGPDCADFPNGLANAPVKWVYHGEPIDLAFKAGFVGAKRDDDGFVSPCVGWFIAHDGRKERKKKGGRYF